MRIPSSVLWTLRRQPVCSASRRTGRPSRRVPKIGSADVERWDMQQLDASSAMRSESWLRLRGALLGRKDCGKLDPVTDPENAVDRAQVIVDGSHRQMSLLGDRLGRMACRTQEGRQITRGPRCMVGQEAGQGPAVVGGQLSKRRTGQLGAPKADGIVKGVRSPDIEFPQ